MDSVRYFVALILVITVTPALAFWLIVLFEERELRDRFGEAYAEYARRVPRFVPRWRG